MVHPLWSTHDQTGRLAELTASTSDAAKELPLRRDVRSLGKLLGRACPHLSIDECAAYDAPYPDASFKAGVRRFPNLVPDRIDAPGARLSRDARAWLSTHWSGASFMAIGMKDPVLGPAVMTALHRQVRGCPAPMEIPEAGHFVQEWGKPIAAAALAHFKLG